MSDTARLLPAGLQLSGPRFDQLDAFGRELRRMNKRINLVSSETETEFWKRHTAHCLALATRSFPAGSRITDWGTGGGLPAIPLAIAFPDCRIIGVDSVRKKVQSCTAVARRLGLDNCSFIHARAEDVDLETDYSVSRATAPLRVLWAWHERVAQPDRGAAGADELESAVPGESGTGPVFGAPKAWPRGLICLKGGDLEDEIRDLKEAARTAGQGQRTIQTIPLSGVFDDPWFEEKMIVVVT